MRTSPGATPWVVVSIRDAFAWDQPNWCARWVVDKPAATRSARSCSASRRRAVSPAAGFAGVTRYAAFPILSTNSGSGTATRQAAIHGRRPARRRWRGQHRCPPRRGVAGDQVEPVLLILVDDDPASGLELGDRRCPGRNVVAVTSFDPEGVNGEHLEHPLQVNPAEPTTEFGRRGESPPSQGCRRSGGSA